MHAIRKQYCERCGSERFDRFPSSNTTQQSTSQLQHQPSAQLSRRKRAQSSNAGFVRCCAPAALGPDILGQAGRPAAHVQPELGLWSFRATAAGPRTPRKKKRLQASRYLDWDQQGVTAIVCPESTETRHESACQVTRGGWRPASGFSSRPWSKGRAGACCRPTSMIVTDSI